MAKKVCHITTVHPSKDVRIFYKECTSLAMAGFDVTLLVLNGESEVCNNVNIVGIKHPFKGRLDRIKNAPSIALKEALKIDADIYHFHDPEFLHVASALKKKGKKVVYDVHEDVPRQILAKYWIPPVFRQLISFAFERFENRIASKMDHIIAATPFIRDRFLKINKYTTDINNYPKLEEFDLTVSPVFNSSSVCYIGGIEKVRGIKELVDALENSEIQLVLAGKFSDPAFEDSIRNLKGWDHVSFKGFLGRQQIQELLRNAMAGLVTLHPIINYLDSLPVKMFEYMAAGIPVIASNFPLWRKIVEANECGLLVNPLEPAEIRTAANTLINDRELAKRLGENGRRAIQEKFNWGIESKKLIDIYNQL